jgi:O-antigen ligase
MKFSPHIKAFLLAAGLLYAGTIVLSDSIIDTTFLPRIFLLSLFFILALVSAYRNKPGIKLTIFTGPFILFYLWNLLSAAWSVSASEAILQAQLVFVSLVIYLLVDTWNKTIPDFESTYIRVLILSLAISFIWALRQILKLEFFDPYQVRSLSANNNLYAGFLLISLPFALSGILLLRGAWRLLSALVSFLALFFIVILQSRAVYIGLAVALLLTAVLLLARYIRLSSRKGILAIIISLVVPVAAVFIFYSSLDATRKDYFRSKIAVWEYFRSYETPAASSSKETSAVVADEKGTPSFNVSADYYQNANLRIIFWKKTLPLIRSHPVTGIGAGNWKLVIASVANPPNPTHMKRNYAYGEPHNEWIRILSELGATGFVLALLFLVLPVCFALTRILFSNPRPPVSTVFYSSFIIGFYCFAFFDFPFRRVEHNVILFSLFAFLFSRIPLKPIRLPGKLKLFSSMGWILLILLLGFTAVVTYARIRGEYYTIRIFENERRDEDRVIGFCEKARNPFYRITPNTLPIEWFEGEAWSRKSDPVHALSLFQEALTLTPFEVRVLNDYGITLFYTNNPAGAKSVLLRSYRIDPFFDDVKLNLGVLYRMAGMTDSARFYISACDDSQRKKALLKSLQ